MIFGAENCAKLAILGADFMAQSRAKSEQFLIFFEAEFLVVYSTMLG